MQPCDCQAGKFSTTAVSVANAVFAFHARINKMQLWAFVGFLSCWSSFQTDMDTYVVQSSQNVCMQDNKKCSAAWSKLGAAVNMFHLITVTVILWEMDS